MKKAILTYKTTSDDAGKTAETICKHKLSMSSALITKLKLQGKIYINEKPCRSIDILKDNDILCADVTEYDKSENIVPTPMKLNILYDDEYITVVVKPRQLSIHPCIESYTNTLANGIMHFWQGNGEYHKFHAVNRLDKNTSGICVIAKNSFAHNALSNQAKSGAFKKRYKAIVHGIPEKKQSTIDLPIKRQAESVIKRITAPDGKPSITHYKVIDEKDGLSLVDIWLETGRTHQIRVHFSAIGHPLVYDWLYGDESSDNEQQGHLLHVYEVEFLHPKTKQTMRFSSPIPEDMSKLLDC